MDVVCGIRKIDGHCLRAGAPRTRVRFSLDALPRSSPFNILGPAGALTGMLTTCSAQVDPPTPVTTNLVLKVHRRVYHSSLGSRVLKKKNWAAPAAKPTTNPDVKTKSTNSRLEIYLDRPADWCKKESDSLHSFPYVSYLYDSTVGNTVGE